MKYILSQEEYDALLNKASNYEEAVSNNENLLREINQLKSRLKMAEQRMYSAEKTYKEISDWKAAETITLGKLRAEIVNKNKEIETLKKKIEELKSSKGSDSDIDRIRVQAFFASL